MPYEKEWRRYFLPKKALESFGLTRGMALLDFGCGYGTFSIAAARIVGKGGLVHALDVDKKMTNRVERKAQAMHLRNINTMVVDISSLRNVRLPKCDFALFANVIHGTRNKVRLLRGARRFLKPKGRIVVMNWKVDESTPRGPSMNLRPTEKETLDYLRRAGYKRGKVIDVPPYHYAVLAHRE